MISITPEPFNLWQSIEFIAMIIIGGLGSIPGSVFGAVFIDARWILYSLCAAYALAIGCLRGGGWLRRRQLGGVSARPKPDRFPWSCARSFGEAETQLVSDANGVGREGLEPPTPCASWGIGVSVDVRGCALTSGWPGPSVRGRPLVSADVCWCWLPDWLPVDALETGGQVAKPHVGVNAGLTPE